MSMEYKEKACDIGSMQAEIAKMRASIATAHLEHERNVERLEHAYVPLPACLTYLSPTYILALQLPGRADSLCA